MSYKILNKIFPREICRNILGYIGESNESINDKRLLLFQHLKKISWHIPLRCYKNNLPLKWFMKCKLCEQLLIKFPESTNLLDRTTTRILTKLNCIANHYVHSKCYDVYLKHVVLMMSLRKNI